MTPPLRIPLLAFTFIAAISSTLYGQHLMGPTGLTGQTGKKDIKITKVDKGSPADGKLKTGDVVIGANGSNFKSNPRWELADAINAAEAPPLNGRLSLILKGNKTVELQLKAYGAFSATAPYDCPKTKALVTAIADKMIADPKGMQNDNLPVGHLGLMATGEQKYIDYVKASLPKQDWANPDREACFAVSQGGKDMGYVGWYWGYALTALAEYQLLTGDKTYMPAIETYALALSKGQDAAGTWGHRMISTARDGRLPGYSHINQPSLSCFIGLTLAQACGVKDAQVQKAIEKCTGFFNTFVGKGTIPYGVHDPNSRDFNNNGMSGSAALAMAFAGDKEGAKFFSRQVATDSDRLETGHASYFFNVLWSPLGANVAGPDVTKEYHKRSRWLYTLYRSWDDKFTHNGDGHKSINTGGALLLNYCTPRKALYITGKNADESIWAKGAEAMAVMDQSKIDYAKLSEDQLIDLFDHEAPQVRRRAQWTMRDREGKGLDQIDALIKSGNKLQKETAIGFYGYKCPPEWAEPRMKLIGGVLENPQEDIEIRAAAASTVCWHQPHAKTYYEGILRLVAEDKSDSFGLMDQNLASALNIASQDPYADGLVKDKKLFYEVVHRLSRNPRQGARGDAMKLIARMPAGDFPLVADDVKLVALNRDPNSHSYHNPGQTLLPAVELLARLGIKEGAEWAYQTMKTKDGKGSFKATAVTAALKAYGANAKDVVEVIKTDEEMLKTLSEGRWGKNWAATIQAIAKGQSPTKEMISFDEAKQGKVAK